MSAELKPVEAPAVAAEEPYPAARYAWYVVAVLTLVYVFSFIDRQILNLLVKEVRRDLGITDTQVSLLMGFGFAFFYAIFGIPLGRLADRRSRRSIVAVGFVFWSIMTAGCGLARNFWQMLLLRMGVVWARRRFRLRPIRSSAITFPRSAAPPPSASIRWVFIYIGSGLAFILGGMVVKLVQAREMWTFPLIGQTRPWQVIFFIVGLPGVLLALLMYTVREPMRRGLKKIQTADGATRSVEVPLGEVLRYISLNWKTFVCHTVGFALLSFSSYGTSAWVPTMFVRNHGWTSSRAGIVYGLVVGIFATLGVVAGGWVSDRMARRGYRDATMRVGLFVSAAWFPFGLLYPMMSDANLAVAFLIPSAFLASAPFGVAPAAIQQIMPNEMRGQASAIYLFVVNLIGLGIGPTAVALTTDYVFHNDNKVNYSILIVCAVAHVLSTLLLWLGLKPFGESLDRLKVWMASKG